VPWRKPEFFNGTATYQGAFPMPTYQAVLDAVKPKLNPGETVVEAVAGAIAGEALHTIVALTSERIRVIAPSGVTAVEFTNLAGVTWAPTWARLNIDLKIPRKRIVLAVFGSEWKGRAKDLADAVKRRVGK
jgi:hypothetical protein